ncbi:hypothetical protein OSB04_020754 [Centaurea solstitialis]|uniref:Uncharacterized protein n=1 Tax=Centaurea solstitialis TaxID=347529 RepID=A0AA38WH51_9ASTR|nr:hypothetical protein OSB04_020754 [Centaurea solstitialis]
MEELGEERKMKKKVAGVWGVLMWDAGGTPGELPKVVEYLKRGFDMKDLGKTKFCSWATDRTP